MREVAEASLGRLREWGWSVQWRCQACGGLGRSDIDKLIAAKGEDYRLTDRGAPCRTPGCEWFVQFYAMLGMRRQSLRTPEGDSYWSDRYHAWKLKQYRNGR